MINKIYLYVRSAGERWVACSGNVNILCILTLVLILMICSDAMAQGISIKLVCYLDLPQNNNLSLDNMSCDKNELWLSKDESEGFRIVAEGISGEYEVNLKTVPYDSSLQFSIYRMQPVIYSDRQGSKSEKLDRLEQIRLGYKIKMQKKYESFWIRAQALNTCKNKDVIVTISFVSGKMTYSTNVRIRIVDLSQYESPVMFINANFAKPDGVPEGTVDDSVVQIASYLNHWNINSLSGAVSGRSLANASQVYDQLFYKIGIKRVRLDFIAMKKYGKIIVGEENDEWSKDTMKALNLYRQLIEKYGNKLMLKLWDEPDDKSIVLLKQGYTLLRKTTPTTLMEVTTAPRTDLYDCIDIFIPRINDIMLDDVRKARAAGKDVYFYANSMHSIRQPLHAMRNIGWLAFVIGANGYHMWCMNCWNGDLNDNEISERSRYGRGFFLYPGNNNSEYWPSMRLEMLKDAAEDYRIYESAAKNPSLLSILNKLLTEGGYQFKEGKKIYNNDARALHDRFLKAVSNLSTETVQ